MSKTRFTPGEWDREYISAILRYARKHSGPWDDAANTDLFSPDENDANLVAAAPDLYAACERILRHIDDVKSDDDLMECRRLLASALAKANPQPKEGKTHAELRPTTR